MNKLINAFTSAALSVIKFTFGTKVGRIILHLLVLLIGLRLFPDVQEVIDRQGPKFASVTFEVWSFLLLIMLFVLASVYVFSAVLADHFGLKLGKNTHNVVALWLGVGAALTVFNPNFNSIYGILCWVLTCLSMYIFLECVVVRRIKRASE